MRYGLLRVSELDTKLRENLFLLSLWQMFKLRKRSFVPGLLTACETWFHHFELETKRKFVEWHSPQLHGRKV
jgi:hypothetical protein